MTRNMGARAESRWSRFSPVWAVYAMILQITTPLACAQEGKTSNFVVIYNEAITGASNVLHSNLTEHVDDRGVMIKRGLIKAPGKPVQTGRYWIFDVWTAGSSGGSSRYAAVSYYRDASDGSKKHYSVSSIRSGFPFTVTPVKTKLGQYYTSAFSARWTWQSGEANVLLRQTAGVETVTTDDDAYAAGQDISKNDGLNVGIIDAWGVEGTTSLTTGLATGRILDASGQIRGFVPAVMTTTETAVREELGKNIAKTSVSDPGLSFRRSGVDFTSSKWTLDDALTKRANSIDVIGELLSPAKTLENGIEAVREKLLDGGYHIDLTP